MGDAHADVSKHVRTYMMVFGALIVGTILTVVASTIHFGGVTNVVIAVLIAAAKASLVAAVFMHLKWEKSISIWWSLMICAVFFAVLMLLPILTISDHPPRAKLGSWDVLPEAAAVEHGGGH